MAEKLVGFPSLTPAFIAKMHVTTVSDVGVTHFGNRLTHFETSSGTIESVPGFTPAFKANIIFGADWLSFDPDGKFGRINLKGIAKTTEEDLTIDFGYTGVIEMTPEVTKIFTMNPEMKTAPFGHAMGSWTILTADPKLKILENSMWTSSGRIIVAPTGLTVESRVSHVSSEIVYPPEDNTVS
ncbi:hypothetical protein B7494_g2483 [Chlorociboria aeruginascens]|nr:hypothetical protein B7494_g2483 [Chlorociboria aeruginascens]